MSRTKVTGYETVRSRMRRAPRAMRSYLADSLYEEGVELMQLSVPLVPVDTGRLRGSHYLAPAPSGKRDPIVEAGYGTKYAPDVHENTAAVHPRGGQAKFLERPFNSRRSGFAARLATRVWSKVNADMRPSIGGGSSSIPRTPKG